MRLLHFRAAPKRQRDQAYGPEAVGAQCRYLRRGWLSITFGPQVVHISSGRLALADAADEVFNGGEGQIWLVAEDLVARLGQAVKAGGVRRELAGQVLDDGHRAKGVALPDEDEHRAGDRW